MNTQSWGVGCLLWMGLGGLTWGQVVPDQTLGSVVTTQNQVYQIEGGTQAGSNLFHSFEDFSVPQGATARFLPDASVSTIFSRVTGGNTSQIEGTLQVKGAANLFLLNPQGIIFGQDARLDLQGSFYGTTAHQVLFADDRSFPTVPSSGTPLLSVRVPIGLQFGQSTAAITVQGAGKPNPISTFSPAPGLGVPQGLTIAPDQQLSLLGYAVQLSGGIVAAPAGNITLGAIQNGTINLTGNTLSASATTELGKLTLDQQSFVDVSGPRSGGVNLIAQDITIDRALITSQNQSGPAGKITIAATGTLEFLGNGSILTETLGSQPASAIDIDAQKVVALNGGGISTKTFSPAEGGDISLRVKDQILLIGGLPTLDIESSALASLAFSRGAGGDITVAADRITLRDGGAIAATNFGAGNSGNLGVSATESIEIAGISFMAGGAMIPSTISTSTLGTGNAGRVTIATQQLNVLDGARVSASTAATGNAGNLTIAASKGILVAGIFPEANIPSVIDASTAILDAGTREALGIQSIPSGNSGDLSITTPQLLVERGGIVSARNDGTGNPGNITIEAATVRLDQGSILAFSQLGQAEGNVQLFVDNLSLNNSLISTSVFQSGNGGDIRITAQDTIEVVGRGLDEIINTISAFILGDGPIDPDAFSQGINAGITDEGVAGDVVLTANQLLLRNGAQAGSASGGRGTAGNTIIYTDRLLVDASLISTSALSTGAAGNILIDTRVLETMGGGLITSNTLATGTAGNLDIKADRIWLEGFNTVPGVGTVPGGLSAGTLGPTATGRSGNLAIQTDQLDIRAGAGLSVTNSGNTGAGSLAVQAQDIVIADRGVIAAFANGGISGGIDIQAQNLTIDRGSIFGTIVGEGKGSDITLNLSNTFQLMGDGVGNLLARISTLNPLNALTQINGVIAGTLGEGRSGEIQLTASSILVTNGGLISTATASRGDAGNIRITGISTQEPSNLLVDASLISTSTFGAGNAGNLDVKVGDLAVINAGLVSTNSTATGNAGNLTAEADRIFLQGQTVIPFLGRIPGGLNAGTITTATGSSGTLKVHTSDLTVTDGASVLVTNTGNSGAGSIDIRANSIDLTNRGSIAAASLGGGISGDVNLTTNTLNLEGGTILGTISQGGRGSNITITAKESVNIQGRGLEDTLGLFASLFQNPNSINSELQNTAGIVTGTLENAQAGNIRITTPNLALRDGALITTASVGRVGSVGNGGDITLEVGDGIHLQESIIFSSTFSEGRAGNIAITSNSLTVDQGIITTNSLAAGRAGNLGVQSNAIALQGQLNIPVVGQIGGINAGVFGPTGRGEAGDLTIEAEAVTISDRAAISVTNTGPFGAGNLAITAQDISLSNLGSIAAIANNGISRGIDIQTDTLNIDRALIIGSVGATGQGSNITIEASKAVTINGLGNDLIAQILQFTVAQPESILSIVPMIPGIVTGTFQSGQSGSIDLRAPSLRLMNGAIITSATLGSGSAGRISLFAPEQLSLNGSYVASATIGTGSGGDILVESGKVTVLGGGQLASTSLGPGRAGNIGITASEEVRFSGAITNVPELLTISSGLNASAISPFSIAGDIAVQAPAITIENGGSIGVNSLGRDAVGNIAIQGNSLQLREGGSLDARSILGSGGNITINLLGDLFIDRYSAISTESGGNNLGGGDGGNITIHSATLALTNGSQIDANAFAGRGGNIEINAQGIFRSADSEITASSRLGVAGTIQINSPEVDPAESLLPLPSEVEDSSQKIVIGCPAGKDSSFVISGGGLPPSALESLRIPGVAPPPPIGLVEVDRWELTPTGSLRLVSQALASTVFVAPNTCNR